MVKGNYSYADTPDMATPEQLKQRRALANYLMFGQGQQDVKHPWQGVSNIASMLAGGFLAKDSANAELEALRKAALSRGVIDPYDIRPPAQLQSEAEPTAEPSIKSAALAYNAPENRDTDTGPLGPEQTRGVIKGNLSDEPVIGMSVENVPPGASIKTASLGPTPPVGPTVAPIAASGPQAVSTALRGGGPGVMGSPPMAPNTVMAQGAPPSAVVPQRPHISREQLLDALANPWVPEGTKQRLQEMHLLQSQPQQLEGFGGKWVVGRTPDGRMHRWFVPTPQKRKVGEVEQPYSYDANGNIRFPGYVDQFGNPLKPPGQGGGTNTPPPPLTNIDKAYD